MYRGGVHGEASGFRVPVAGFSLFGPVDPSFRALSGRLDFTVRVQYIFIVLGIRGVRTAGVCTEKRWSILFRVV